MRFGLGLGMSRLGVGNPLPNRAPTDIAWAGSHTVAEDAALGTVVGGALSFTDPDVGETGTFSLTDDASGKFAIDGTSVIVAGVLDYEDTDGATNNITIRFTDSGGRTYDESFAITVTDVSEGVQDSDALTDGGEVIEDGEFDVPPTVTVVANGNIKIHGKKSGGSFGKILYDLGPAVAGRKYTLEYNPDFSLLSNDGKNAMVGFCFKSGNDFHFIGQRGDGSSGLDSLAIYGDDLWNAGSGFTETGEVVATNGTQAGPNWQQLETADDAADYVFRSSGDSGATFDDELTDIAPTPFADVEAATQFGIGIFLASGDTGSFSVEISVWIDEAAEWTPAALASSELKAWYDFSDTATITESGGAVSQVNDKSGNGNHIIQGTAAAKPTTGANTLNSLNVLTFDGGDRLEKTSGTSLPSAEGSGSMLFALRLVSSGTGAGLVWIAQQAGSFGDNAVLCRDGGNMGAWGDATSGAAASAADYADSDNTNWHLSGGVYTESDRWIYEDGTLKDTNTGNIVGPTTPDGIYVGQTLSMNRGAARYLTGRIAQVLVVNGITQDTREKIEGWALWKYGLQANLPVGHPYENAPP
jgi:hypothetical protein